jgi:hypothetical protein
MKRFVLTFGTFIACFAASAQIPNPGMENWTTQPGGYEEPDGWLTFNAFYIFDVPLTTFKSTDAHSGDYAALLETVVEPNPGGGDDLVFPGAMNIGIIYDIMTEEGVEGTSVTGTPDSLVGWFKFHPVNGDEFDAYIELTKWNNDDQVSESIAVGSFVSNGALNEYTRIAIPIVYTTAGLPDSMKLGITNVAVGGSDGTQLWIDDLSLVEGNVTAINEQTAPLIRFYPNPAGDVLMIDSQAAERIEVFDALGAKVGEVDCNGYSAAELTTSEYRNGVYFLKMESGKCSRFVVKH